MINPRLKTIKAVNLVRYILTRVPECSYEKLFLILFQIDMTHFIETGKSMTGFTYVADSCGPVPAPSQFLKVMKLA